MFAFLHSSGNISVSRQFLKIRCNDSDTEQAQILSRVLKFHHDHELYFGQILTVSSTKNSKYESLSLVSKFILIGTVLSFCSVFRYRSALFSK